MTAPATAMVLAAGLGTRMRPLTDDRPKALVQVGGRALIDHMLDRLGEAGVERAVVNVHAHADRLIAHLARRDRAPATTVSDERDAPLPLETGGGVRRARPLLGEGHVWIANIDSVWIEHAPALAAMAAAWEPARMDTLLLLARMEASLGFDGPGDAFLAEDGRVELRRMRPGAMTAPFAVAGVSIADPATAYARPQDAFSLFPLWAEQAAAGRLHGVVLDGDWMHVGDPAARDAAEARLAPSAKAAREVSETLDLFADAPEPSGLFAGRGPRWFTIAPHRAFLDDLAAGLLAELEPRGPDALSDAVVLTPTRRGARALAEAFVRAAGGRALLLPQIRAVGDLDEGEPPFEPGDLSADLQPAVTPLRRRFELARLVVANAGVLGREPDPASALDLADALAGFLDSCAIEEVNPRERLPDLAPGDLAEHWMRSVDFLRIAGVEWPRRLDELGLLDVTERRTRLLRALADQWSARPPAHPLVAAGSTGTAPAAADLLRVVAAAPQGAVVLPGLDLALAPEVWERLPGEQGEAHPQGAMARLLKRAGVARAAVRPWPGSAPGPGDLRSLARARVVNEALRPAEATEDWLSVLAEFQEQGRPAGIDPLTVGLEGLSVLAALDEEGAAAQAAVLLREALETPGKTAALVTPDPALARRVSARLWRWGITVDNSAGAPLAQFPAGVLLTLLARAVADPLDPATLLAIAKHPLTLGGMKPSTLGRARWLLERRGLRGQRPAGWTALEERLGENDEAKALAAHLRDAIAHAAAPFDAGPAAAEVAVRALAEAMERVGSDDGGRLGELWAGPGGEAAASLVAALVEDGAGLPPATPLGFAQLVESLALQAAVRTGGAVHPRLQILGAIEARLVRADRLVLAGLEEGTWPRPAPVDPFLSRPMRAELGLPPPERRTGLSAHDFAQAACAPEVVMIHAERRGSQPAVKSRWLWRLETLARGAGVALPSRPEVAGWARALDAAIPDPPPELRLAPRPEPTPPLEARPRTMGVTRVEEWVRNPYATYARFVLALKPLDRPDEPVEARQRGTAVHKAFERFALDGDPRAEAFERLLLQELEAAGLRRARMARERPLARRLSQWITEWQAGRDAAEVTPEAQGELALPAAGGPFTVTAKADRLERRPGGVDVLDFKTGTTPTGPQVRAGFSPQLTLTAAILAQGGFAGLGPSAPGDLMYVKVTGRRVAGEAMVRGRGGGDSADMAARALEGLRAHVARYDDAAYPYRAWTAPQFIKDAAGDYDHLARTWEWHVKGEDENAPP